MGGQNVKSWLVLIIWACLSVLGLVSAVDIENVACFSMIPRVFIY